ncbi:uncharacterized protein EI97DRAFT_453946 [Westerdykella ornata]|uniref:Uncharacterized protein n=1 Tax=Westerdykella ornata TaxID=318751 RepID=A0A6A6JWW7_WESOR|nr:uncharacterized protein EI97DRAFT_453946 [Westerdykella ornata]KAF2280694.1 hypothetical protein EI97DRAFT_453946 [Westerdykella ornata]
MASGQNGEQGSHEEPDFTKAFQDLARGERTAAALENHLDALEKKIEELLAKADEEDRKRTEQRESKQDNVDSATSKPGADPV